MIKKLFGLYFLFTFFDSKCQQWEYLGDSSACDFAAENPMVCVNRYDEVSIVYRDMSNAPEETAVKKFDGTKWVHDGGFVFTGWTLGGYHQPCISYDTAGFPYVAVCNDYLTVRRFDGSNWITVGDTQFTPGVATSVSFKVSPDNTPYIAFRDFAHNANISVMKFNGSTWVYVGQPGFSPNSSQQYNGGWCPSIAFDKTGVPYVAYIDITNNYRLSVMKFSGTNWVYVGNSTVAGGAGIPTLVMDSQGSPIVAYTDGDLHVKKFNGSAWVSLGPLTIATNADFPFLTIDKNDKLYIAYTVNNKANVLEYDGNGWMVCGQPDFHPAAYRTTIGATADGSTLYVGLTDGRNLYDSTGSIYNIVSVMKLQKSPYLIKKAEISAAHFAVDPNPAQTSLRIQCSIPTEAPGIIKIINSYGQVMYEIKFFNSLDQIVDLSKYSRGTYFVEVRSTHHIAHRKIIID